MAEGKAQADWWRTACLMALIANCHRAKGRAFSPEDFYPFGRQRPANRVPVTELKDILFSRTTGAANGGGSQPQKTAAGVPEKSPLGHSRRSRDGR